MEERLMRVLRGVVYRLKRIGPRTEPCDTPQMRGSKGERDEIGCKQLMCGMIGKRYTIADH